MVTTRNAASAAAKLVAAEAVPMVLGSLVMGNLVCRNYKPEVVLPGDTVNVQIAPAYTVTIAGGAEGGAATAQSEDPVEMPVRIDRRIEVMFIIPDVYKVLAVPEILEVCLAAPVAAIAERIERDLLNLYSGFTSNPAVGTAGTAPTEAVVDAAETALFSAKIPSRQNKYLLVDADTYSALRQNNSKFTEYSAAGEAGICALIPGSVGRFGDFFVLRSPFVAKTKNPENAHNLAFARDAMGLVIRRCTQPSPGTGIIAEYAELGNVGFMVSMEYNPDMLAQRFTLEMLYGVAILRNEFGVQVNS